MGTSYFYQETETEGWYEDEREVTSCHFVLSDLEESGKHRLSYETFHDVDLFGRNYPSTSSYEMAQLILESYTTKQPYGVNDIDIEQLKKLIEYLGTIRQEDELECVNQEIRNLTALKERVEKDLQAARVKKEGLEKEALQERRGYKI